MEVSAQQDNKATKQEDERIELKGLLHTTTHETESKETTLTTVVEVPTMTEVDQESHAQEDSDGGDSGDQSCCTRGKQIILILPI